MNDYALIISEPGYDADNCPPENTIFDTRYDTPKAIIDTANPTVRRVTFIFTTTPPVGNTTLYEVNHNYGYRPLTLSYLDRKVSSTPTMGQTSGHFYVAVTGIWWLGQIVVKSNTTKTWFEFQRTAYDPGSMFPADIDMTGKTFTFNLYIFANDSAG